MAERLTWHTDVAEARAESLRLRRPVYVDVFKEQ
jgi:hypothetical protein